jgi:4'-phosphopantetheinyl transferase
MESKQPNKSAEATNHRVSSSALFCHYIDIGKEVKMINVYALKIPKDMSPAQYEQFSKFISIEKREKINRFLNRADAYRSLFGELLVRSAICEMNKIQNKEIIFNTNAYGKPYLENNLDLSFNISHSGEWVVSIVSKIPVGIDIERIRPLDLNVAKQFFSIKEYTDLVSKNSEEHLNYFYDLWTLKESYIKALGKGLSIPLDSFEIRKQNQEKIVGSYCENLGEWFFKQYSIDPEYKLSVCAKTNQFPRGIIMKDPSLLYKVLHNS